MTQATVDLREEEGCVTGPKSPHLIGIGRIVKFSRFLACRPCGSLHARFLNCQYSLICFRATWIVKAIIFHLFLGPLTDDYLVTDGPSVRGVVSVSRADVAHFMLKSLQTNQWDNKAVRIATKK